MATTVPATGTMLGRYQVLKPLAKGGMAEVLLARTIGLGGFARHVVIKRIRVDSRSDQQAIDMFLDEARLVASLHHRNIVQVHDVGEEGGKFFFVMEYVHGRDTRELLRNVKDKKEQIPLEHVLTIVTAAAAGLHYAHEQRGPDRKPLNIVHRDISPGNILLAFDGGVKVLDFGIAKAEARTAETQAGEMKGKVGYMSPEQCRSQPIDRRTDIFQLGIVLYELCTVRRLFKADSRFETMAHICDGDVPPPTKWRKDIPDDLEHIILKTLAKTPEDRYETADELRLVLEAFAARAGLPLSPSRLSDYLKDQFGEVPEPWLVDEHVPPPPPDVIERIRSSSQLIAVGRPSQTMIETSKPEPVSPQDPPMTAESVDAEPMIPAPAEPIIPAAEAAAIAAASLAKSAAAAEAALAESPGSRQPAEPSESRASTETDPVEEAEALDEEAPERAEPAVQPPLVAATALPELRPVSSTKSTQPELEALKAAKPIADGVPAGPEEDEPPPRSAPVYPAYPTAPRSYRALAFLAVFILVAAAIAGGVWYLSKELEQSKAAAVPMDAAAAVAPDANIVTESASDAAVEAIVDAAIEPTATSDAGAGSANLDHGSAAKPGASATKPGATSGSGATKPTTGATTPGAAATKPAADATKPAPDATKPAADAMKPAPDATKPAADATKPAPDATKPAPLRPKPVKRVVPKPKPKPEPVDKPAEPAPPPDEQHDPEALLP